MAADENPPLPNTPVPQQIYTDTLDDATLKLLSKVWRNAAPIEIWDSAADEVMVRIVTADHDLQLLRQITDSESADILLNIAEWTGLTSLYQLKYARTELEAGGVDVSYPEWGELEKRHHSIPELITLNKLGSQGAVMLASGHPAADWVAAIEALAEALYNDSSAADVAALGAKNGMTPPETVQTVKALLNAGVKEYYLADAFGPDALPADLLAKHGDRLGGYAANMGEAGLPRQEYFGLLRDGIPAPVVHGFVHLGEITDPGEIKAMHADGAHPAFMARARAEALPVERWAAVMKPLAPFGSESKYGDGWVSNLKSKPGLYRLEELSADGVVLPLRVAWDSPGRIPEALSPEQRRTLAERGVGPAEFLAVFERLPQSHSYFKVDARPVTDDDVLDAISVVTAGGADTCAVLERLRLGSIDRRTAKRTRLRTTAQEMWQLVQLVPTEQEALYLGSVADTARGWIGQLQLWRRFEPETAEFTAMLHAMPEIEPFLVWLGQQKVTNLFYGKNPIRTEAVRMLTSKNPKGARPSYLHFVVLAEALERHATTRSQWWTEEAVEGSKRLRHQIQQFMLGVSVVARREHIGEHQDELGGRREIERGLKALMEKEN